MDREHVEPTRSFLETLTTIHEGGQRMVAALRLKVSKLDQAIFEGRFLDASTIAGEVNQLIGPLATAEHHMTMFKGTHLVHARDVIAGDEVRGFGTIAEREDVKTPCVSGAHDHDQVKLTFEGADEPLLVDPGAEMLIVDVEETPTG